MTRTFDDRPAVRERVPLLLGIVGPSSSGKTFSAFRLAAGMQRVIGGEVFGIDTEARRMLHYSDRFKFRHVDFQPPHGPLDYLAAIQHCIDRGAKILIIDSMTHEHTAVTDASAKWLDEKCGDDWKKREKLQMLSWVKPKQDRKKLNSEIVRLGISAVFCYRAQEKIKPVKGDEPVKLGWQPETTSNLHYDMTARFLLTPGCDGKPSFLPETDAEKRMVKRPEQFRDWFKDGVQLSEDIGENLARWAAGDAASGPAKTLDDHRAALQSAATLADLAAAWQSVPGKLQKELLAAKDARKAELQRADKPAERQPGDEDDYDPDPEKDEYRKSGDLFPETSGMDAISK